MTNQEMASITQADREAAADAWEVTDVGTEEMGARIRKGAMDHDPYVQAFARHRTTSLSLATNESASDPAWLPIEQIPEALKDGSTIIALGINYGSGPGRHLALVFWDGDRPEPGWFDRAEGDQRYAYLTHYCPVTIPTLPPPPAKDTQP